MADFKTHFLLWISSILDHWGFVATGGILVFMIQLAKEKWPSKFNWRFTRWTAVGFLCFAVFQSWEAEYVSRTGREHDLMTAHLENAALHQQLDFQTQSWNAKCDSKDAVNGTLQKQNRDQQTTINGCLTQAMKLLTPGPSKIVTKFVALPVFHPIGSAIMVIATTSQDRPSFVGRLSCNSPFHMVETDLTDGSFTHSSQWNHDVC